MPQPRVSVVIPTRNRPEKLLRTVSQLALQFPASGPFELIVCDDGSAPPVALPEGELRRVVRLMGRGRSAARNAGADAARGEVLVFLDDDMLVAPDFLAQHLEAHRGHPNALVTGGIRLQPSSQRTAFGRFRQSLEDSGLPRCAGPSGMPNLCATGNASIPREAFARLGGFDPSIESGEDQDLALRHAASGGQNVFWPGAGAIHDDEALDIERYCRRVEWGMRQLGPFVRRYPDWRDNRERERINGPIALGCEPLGLSARKLAKRALGTPPLVALLLVLTRWAERAPASQALLDRLYALLLGIHVQRGYRGRE